MTLAASSAMTPTQRETAQRIVATVVARKCPAGVDHEDAAQTLLAVVVASLPRYDATQGAWSTFCGTIAHNRIKDVWRAQMRRQRINDRLAAMSGGRVDAIEDWCDVESFIKKLTKRQQVVFRARHGIGADPLSRAQLSHKLGVGICRVRQLEHAAGLHIVRLIVAASGRGRLG